MAWLYFDRLSDLKHLKQLKYILNLTSTGNMLNFMQLNLSDLNLVYACTKDKTLMIDVQAREISERDLEAALRLAHPEVIHYAHNTFQG